MQINRDYTSNYTSDYASEDIMKYQGDGTSADSMEQMAHLQI